MTRTPKTELPPNSETTKPQAIDLSPPPAGYFSALRHIKIGESTIAYGIKVEGEKLEVEIQSLRTSGAGGNGSARRAMEHFLRATDEANHIVFLAASPLNKRTKLTRLVRFYQSLGFDLTGQSINPAGDPKMKRLPRVSPALDSKANDEGNAKMASNYLEQQLGTERASCRDMFRHKK